jgi:hypothetical protein
MAVTRLDIFDDDAIVLHFGGPNGISAQTLAEALLGFAEASVAISSTIDPGSEIEIVVEATGSGSFRTTVRRIKKNYGGLLAIGSTIFWGVVTNIIYDAAFKHDDKPIVIVTTDEVIIQHGDKTVVVPRRIHEETQKAKRNPKVASSLTRTFAALEADDKVTDFGITGSLSDREPVIKIPRKDFPAVVHFPQVVTEPPEPRTRKERARLVVLKAWLNASKRKWSFEWNGVPVSAPIRDQSFLDSLDRREVLFGHGDVLDVEIEYSQTYDVSGGVFINDPHSFVVTRVIRKVPKD